MTTAYVPASTPTLSFGSVIGRVFSTLGRAFLPSFLSIYAVGVVCSLVNFAITIGITTAAGGDYDRLSSLTWLSIVSSFATLAISYAMATTVMTQAALAVENGETPGFMQLLRPSLAALFPVALVGVIYSIVFWLAAFFFLIPSLFVRVFWIVAGPARAGEKIVWLQAFSRSARLTDGSRIVVAALALLYGVAMTALFYALFLGLIAIIGGLSTVMPQVNTMGTNLSAGTLAFSLTLLVFYGAAMTLLMMINAAMPAALYVELRVIKEGASTRRLDQVFA